jgi:hypothetical protein
MGNLTLFGFQHAPYFILQQLLVVVALPGCSLVTAPTTHGRQPMHRFENPQTSGIIRVQKRILVTMAMMSTYDRYTQTATANSSNF